MSLYDYIAEYTNGVCFGYGSDSDLAAKIAVARFHGLLIHHEYSDTMDHWYCASPEWVANYHNSGGLWGYMD